MEEVFDVTGRVKSIERKEGISKEDNPYVAYLFTIVQDNGIDMKMSTFDKDLYREVTEGNYYRFSCVKKGIYNTLLGVDEVKGPTVVKSANFPNLTKTQNASTSPSDDSLRFASMTISYAKDLACEGKIPVEDIPKVAKEFVSLRWDLLKEIELFGSGEELL